VKTFEDYRGGKIFQTAREINCARAAFDAGVSEGMKQLGDDWRQPLQDRIEKLAGELAVAWMSQGTQDYLSPMKPDYAAIFVNRAAAIIAEAERVSKEVQK
jgi:hypothetical protein